MTFADSVLKGSNDSETSDSDDSDRFDELVDKFAPNPDHTRKMVENSSDHPKDKTLEILEALEDGREDLMDLYEAYRETVDFRRATGAAMGSCDYNNYQFEESVEDWDSYNDAQPVDGAVLGPIYCWNRLRMETLRDEKLKDEPGNLRGYRAVFPEPRVDGLDLWIEADEIGPDSWDSHIYCSPEMFEDFGDCEGHIPPETVEEYKEQHQFPEQDNPEPEPEHTPKNDAQQCAAIASTTGDRCKNEAQEGCKTCGHHDDETSDLVDTSHEDTTEKAGSDDSDDTQSLTHKDYSESDIDLALQLADGDKVEAMKILKAME